PQPIKAPKPATKNVTVPWPGGIFESAQAPFPPALYRIQNQWQGQIGSEYVQVFAGAKGSDSEQGVIVVLTTSVTDLTDHSRQTGGLYLTPGRFGNVHISAATGTELTLATPDGKTFRFDVASRLLAMP
ncbi:MAG: hypothetical protein M3O80_08605, partial [Chloroflexota bacterium]|nr:hypothetical protein [Chloroflexota bacterium]